MTNLEKLELLEKDERDSYLKTLTHNECLQLASLILDRLVIHLDKIAVASGHPTYAEFHGEAATPNPTQRKLL